MYIPIVCNYGSGDITQFITNFKNRYFIKYHHFGYSAFFGKKLIVLCNEEYKRVSCTNRKNLHGVFWKVPPSCPFTGIFSSLGWETAHRRESEAEKVIFLPLRMYISLTAYKPTKYCGSAREAARFFEVSTRHLDVVTIAPRGALVPCCGFRIQFCPAAIISFRSVARILVAPSSSVPPQVAT